MFRESGVSISQTALEQNKVDTMFSPSQAEWACTVFHVTILSDFVVEMVVLDKSRTFLFLHHKRHLAAGIVTTLCFTFHF